MKFIQLICVVLFVTSCQAQVKKQEKNIANNKQEIVREAPITFIKRFLVWYKDNYTQLNSLEIVKKDDKDNYTVDFNKSKLYLANLNKGGFFDEEFISNLSKHFDKCEKRFTEDPQNDGPPQGFDYDLILLTQDIQSVFDKISTLKIIEEKATDNKASVKIDVDMRLDFKLKYFNGWRIYEIENLGLE